MSYLFGGSTDIGNHRKLQEDFIVCKEFGAEDNSDVLAIVADGTGTSDDRIQPAVLAVTKIVESIDRVKTDANNLFEANPLFFLKNAMLQANDYLGMLKIADEEMYSGYAASISLLYLFSDGRLFYTHAGNTRIYLLRDSILTQLTEDHTLAQQKINDEELEIDYYASSDRLVVTNDIGHVADPYIYEGYGRMKENDIFIMTTDGIHYAIQPDYIQSIVLESIDPETASKNLVMAAKDVVNYPDNMSAIVIAERK